MKLQTNNGDVSAYGFACGYSQSFGPMVNLWMEHGAYIVKRHPDHPAGWLASSFGTLAEARKFARKARHALVTVLDEIWTRDGKFQIVTRRDPYGSTYPHRRFAVVLPSGMTHARETEAQARACGYWPEVVA